MGHAGPQGTTEEALVRQHDSGLSQYTCANISVRCKQRASETDRCGRILCHIFPCQSAGLSTQACDGWGKSGVQCKQRAAAREFGHAEGLPPCLRAEVR